MEELNSVIKSVCVISAAICILEGLTDGTRFRNQMKFLLNLIFITVVAAPLLKGTVSLELPDITNFMESDYSESSELYTAELKKQTEFNISQVLQQQIEAAGIKCSEIETKVNISETNSISISSVTVTADDFEAAADIIRNSLGKETEVYNGNT